MDYLQRKTTRLPGYDYNTPGYYFITICVKDKEPLLGRVVGTGLPDGPKVTLFPYGSIAHQQLELMQDFYENIKLDKFVIMPNHIHMILHIPGSNIGPSGRPVPTDSLVGNFVGTFKRFCNREYGRNIWQPRSHDHIIRNEQDYLCIWNYIDGNPGKWADDCFHVDM